MFCVSDPALLAFSLGVCTVVILRWKSLPADVQIVHSVLDYGRRLLVRVCASRPPMSVHLSSLEHFPRPPRTLPEKEIFSPDYVRTPSVTSLAQDNATEPVLYEPQDGPTLTRAMDESASEEPVEESVEDSTDEE